jgi:hypothetical protein
MCDGKTIMSEMLTDLPGQSSVHKFPTQKPTKAEDLVGDSHLQNQF